MPENGDTDKKTKPSVSGAGFFLSGKRERSDSIFVSFPQNDTVLFWFQARKNDENASGLNHIQSYLHRQLPV